MAQRYPTSVARRAASAVRGSQASVRSGGASVPESTTLTHAMRRADSGALLNESLRRSSRSILDESIEETIGRVSRAAAWGTSKVPPPVRKAARRLLPLAARMHPAIRSAELARMLIDELMELWNTQQDAGLYMPPGWTVYGKCPSPKGPVWGYGINLATSTVPFPLYVTYANSCTVSAKSGPWPPPQALLNGKNHLGLVSPTSPGNLISGSAWNTYLARPYANRFQVSQAGRVRPVPAVGMPGLLPSLRSAAAGAAGAPGGVPGAAPSVGPQPRPMAQRAVSGLRRVSNGRDPLVMREVGPETPRAPTREEDAELVIGPKPGDPWREVAGRLPEPAPKPVIEDRPSTHVRQPTRGERKVAVRGSLLATYLTLGRIFGGLTELGDFINAVWKALPRHHRRPRADSRGKRRWQWQMEDLARGWRELDVAEAVSNVVANQIEDAAIGRLQRALNSRTGLISQAPVYGLGTRLSKAGALDAPVSGLSDAVEAVRSQSVTAWKGQ